MHEFGSRQPQLLSASTCRAVKILLHNSQTSQRDPVNRLAGHEQTTILRVHAGRCGSAKRTNTGKGLFFHLHLSFHRVVVWPFVEGVATRFSRFSRLSATLCESAELRSVRSLILHAHLLSSLPCFPSPSTVPCWIVFAKPELLFTWPYRFNS